MTRRFYVEGPALASDQITLDGALAHRITTVLRLRDGDEVALFDGTGVEARVRIAAASAKRIEGIAVERYAAPAEPHTKVELYQSITKGERFEWLLEKGTEIGVTRFVPLITARAVVKTEEKSNRAERWRRIVVEAAEQCGRGAVPGISAPMTFDDALRSADGVVLIPYEAAGELAPNIQTILTQEIDALFALATVSVLIGPEGGFEPDEIERAQAVGAHVVTLGDRVLRSETAGLVASTLVLHAAGELG